MSVTIKDVAKKAKVSPSTVSRVISDNPRISEKTKRNVRKVMQELGYHMNYNARVLVQQKTQTIGIVMKKSSSDSLHDPFFPEVLRAISSYCNKVDYSIMLTTGESEKEIYEDLVNMVRGKRVDGIIVTYAKQGDEVVQYLLDSHFPFVLVGSPDKNENDIIYVDNDNGKAAEEATNHLIKRGHTHIGFITNDLNYEVSIARNLGYEKALLDNHLPNEKEYILSMDKENHTDYITQYLKKNKDITAVVVTDDYVATKVLHVCRELQINIPNDLSMISFNNSFIAEVSYPSLTSIDTQVYQLGSEAAKCLIEEINEPSEYKKSIIIPTIIVEREST